MTIEFNRIQPAPVSRCATSFDVRMRDGIRLATDVYLPRGTSPTEPGPTILIRLPYDKNGSYTFIPEVAAYMTRRGYRVVAQDVRGKFRSEGQTLLFVNEADDGYDTIEWIVQQPFSDGAVAMWGDSYYGYTQWAAVAGGHPALRAISPRVTGTGLGEFPVAAPGAATRDVEMAIVLMYPLTNFHSRDTFEWEPDWSHRPYIRDLSRFQEQVGRSPSFDLWYPHPVILPRFPHGSPFRHRAIPVLHTIGWWDNCAPWSWRDHEAMQQRADWAHNEYLLIESIDHENNHFGEVPHTGTDEPDAIKAMLPGYLDPSLEFFDVFLRGQGSPSDIPRVRWNLAGTDGYRRAAAWPPEGVRPITMYPTESRDLARSSTEHSSSLLWVHNPDDLVPSPVPDPFAFLEVAPDEQKSAVRVDVLAFTGEAVQADVDLVGPVSFRAVITSDGPCTDLFVRLYDVAPDGHQLRIARGQQHILDTTEAADVTIDLGHLGYRLAAGHRLRLQVHSSDFPEFLPQPGTSESPWTAVEVAPTTQALAVGGERGAYLRLGVLDDPGPACPLLNPSSSEEPQ